jgi:hypothetical protein
MNKRNLIVGDLLALLIVTVAGFVSHRETDASFLPRAAVLFVSLSTGWFLLAPAMGLFDVERLRTANPLWRPAVTAFFAAQFAVTLRGLLLHTDTKSIFAVVIGITSAIGMTLARWIAQHLFKRN